MRPDSSDYASIFIDDLPLMDVRAPVEFAKGAFPQALNLPLMNDGERQQVGACYKQRGQQAAIALGHELVRGAIKAQRVQAWAEFAQAHPDGYLYCFRGGLRSQIAQQWLDEAGVPYPRIVGGYKAMRGFLIQTLEVAIAQCDFILVGGLTGSGKTELLAELDNAIDLEGHANHRGSSFGKHATPQPCQINFENSLAIDLLKKRHQGLAYFALEEESRSIGSCFLPLPLQSAMPGYPMVWLEDDLDGRVNRILRDYVVDLCAEYVAIQGEPAGFLAYADRLRLSLAGISRRLGGARHQRLASIMDEALATQQNTGAVEGHRDWIRALLTEYYDPMYAFQKEGKGERILFSGRYDEVLAYLKATMSQRRHPAGKSRVPA
ncbi:tRNA 2-selenouridine(34) synthase MnmH [Pollutimonas thiosulfatoxidans]|uniref:tRNA 2-selenouridine synthase n=1 Tax=Pollutimonas thiosulfatoxidans TaxID=2028345 RepID=A0A410GD01_9BURK|nr:tRNA 2-selenouridine(34) synthase MnmH [Pollutimonas thiosulfatoxidans]NYT43919.1 tRNA 2-selenouridine(34) synthase MnmH [Alcaligenaceae bacterium]QAA94177.1 tRNA 2-selenouridine(34) synthase MnmH [Pollutimonas thiosulfatoxidans]